MKADIKNSWKEENGVSAVIGAILISLVVGTMWGTIQAYYVPNWNEDVEYKHLDTVYDDMMTFKSDVEDVALYEAPKTSNFHLGVRYPDRMFLANPGTGVAGSLNSDNVAINIEYTIDGLSNPKITTSYTSNRVIYEVQGTVDSPKLVYEHGVIIRDYGSENATKDEQSLIVGDEIFIPILTGNLTSVSSMETETIDIKPMSQSSSRTKILSANITLSTGYAEVWEDLLAGTSTADTTVQVDTNEGEINIVTTAVELISFPAGDVTADTLYAGLIILRTESDSVTYTNIDVSEDYPCILDISIDEGSYAQTQSTITATVKNATAPFDIHADFTELTNDPETYDVFPDSSSPDSISATSWDTPNENTVRWTNITHPTLSGEDAVVISFWVINTENNTQFFTERVFIRKNLNSWY